MAEQQVSMREDVIADALAVRSMYRSSWYRSKSWDGSSQVLLREWSAFDSALLRLLCNSMTQEEENEYMRRVNIGAAGTG